MTRVSERGSVLLLVLFVCLAVAVLVQTLTAVIVCSERCAADESLGRQRMLEKEEGLSWIRERAALSWEPFGWEGQTGTGGTVEGRLDILPAGGGWTMQAAVRQPYSSLLKIEGRVERGRDGVDLPLAALVAKEVVAPMDRTMPWLTAGSEVTGACAHVVRSPGLSRVGPGCELFALQRAWSLDPGWRDTLVRWADGASSGTAVGALAPGLGLLVIKGEPGRTLQMPPTGRGSGPRDPVLVVMVGGGRLDLRGMGKLHGVVVVDGGSLLLDGTSVHGAVFVTDAVDVGGTGEVAFDEPTLRWATDRSLYRVRLVPGSRRETKD